MLCMYLQNYVIYIVFLFHNNIRCSECSVKHLLINFFDHFPTRFGTLTIVFLLDALVFIELSATLCGVICRG